MSSWDDKSNWKSDSKWEEDDKWKKAEGGGDSWKEQKEQEGKWGEDKQPKWDKQSWSEEKTEVKPSDPWEQKDPWGGNGGKKTQQDEAAGEASGQAADTSAWSSWEKGPEANAWGGEKAGGYNWGGEQQELTEEEKKQQAEEWEARIKASRQRHLAEAQTHYAATLTLPGKTPEEMAHDHWRLFKDEDQAGADFDRYEDVPFTLTGPNGEETDIPVFTEFKDLFEHEVWNQFMPPELINNLQLLHFHRPTPVQRFAIPCALIGRDVMCCAQTGSGKTAAFLIPVIASMMQHGKQTGAAQEPYWGSVKPDTLIITPTRELCVQTFTDAERFCHKTNHRCCRVYGQEDVKTQIWEIAKGCDLLVATPGRLHDLVKAEIIELKDVHSLVLDEADRMLTAGFEETIRDMCDNYGMPGKEDRQTMMFSATFPMEMQKLALDYMSNHIFVSTGTAGGGATSMVTQEFLQVGWDNKEKIEALLKTIHLFIENRKPQERMLIFCNGKNMAKALDEQLFDQGFSTGALHGDLDQRTRELNLQRFRDGEIDVIFATDLASRGLDIRQVSVVVNFDLPKERDVYVQRIGRTGRIGHRGKSISFIMIGPDGKFYDDPAVLRALKDICAQTKNQFPDWLEQGVGSLPEAWATNDDKWSRQDWRQSAEWTPQEPTSWNTEKAPAPADAAPSQWEEESSTQQGQQESAWGGGGSYAGNAYQ